MTRPWETPFHTCIFPPGIEDEKTWSECQNGKVWPQINKISVQQQYDARSQLVDHMFMFVAYVKAPTNGRSMARAE
jgi:hypothetical protein